MNSVSRDPQLSETNRDNRVQRLVTGALIALGFGVLALGAVTAHGAPAVAHTEKAGLSAATIDPNGLSAADSSFLDEIEQRSVLFFIEQSHPDTGMVRDRAPLNGDPSSAPASAAATGFGLSAWCIADARGWVAPGEALAQVKKNLRFVWETHEHERGWLYHYTDAGTGVRAWKSEASTIDTALFLQGAVMAREYLNDPEVTDLVNKIYARVDWQWAMNGGKHLSHGWKPESGFIRHRWTSYSELMGMVLLGLGAPESALPAEAWTAWSRKPIAKFDGYEFIQCGPLFTHQYSHAWFDFRGRRDGFADYFQNSVNATLAQRAWSAQQSKRFPSWSENLWGLTASDGPKGYMAWGTPIFWKDETDGTVVPCAPGGSLPFAPAECLAALKKMRSLNQPGVWGRYGFTDAFNPETGWASTDVIGIDVGITLLMAENLRTGFVWEHFMRAPEVQKAMRLAGFSEPARSIVQTAVPAALQSGGQ